ncbi:unnamed protein product [Protopolystoma xenopodis]|uniref:Uncharacterized protein n=1 Tax=Protopolystoma xenopodis TaxID=117903 RepID=A0A448WGE8_9PLAT|nr:unnamed protein product [Protopolystoma xenopodis]
MINTHFADGKTGPVEFDENGDRKDPLYDIMNCQSQSPISLAQRLDPFGICRLSKVGEYGREVVSGCLLFFFRVALIFLFSQSFHTCTLLTSR